MEEPLLAEHRDALRALASGPPQDSHVGVAPNRVAPNAQEAEEIKKTPVQPAGNLHGKDLGDAPNPHQEEEDAMTRPQEVEMDADLQGDDSSAPPNPHQAEDAKKPQLEPHQKPQPNDEDGSLKPSVDPKNLAKNDDGPQESAAVNSDKKKEVEPQTPTLAFLTEQARDFAKSAAGTSMATAAKALCSAAEQFASGKGRKKKVIETDLNKTDMILSSVAEAAPCSEARLATRAINLTSAVQSVLLSDTGEKPGEPAGWWRWRRAASTSSPARPRRPSLKERIRAAISAREPMLPIYTEHEKQLVDKREVLYALALAAPVAILTAAGGLKVFSGSWAWVAGASAGVWVLAASGMVLNQYSVFDWEWLAAGHVSRLGVLGAAVLFCFFTYRAFFPSTSWALGVLLGITAVAFGFPWILSCIRGDDDVISASAKSDRDAAGRAGNLEMRQARRRTI